MSCRGCQKSARQVEHLIAMLKRALSYIDGVRTDADGFIAWAETHDELLTEINKHEPAWSPGDV
jgi:hypothetical protein